MVNEVNISSSLKFLRKRVGQNNARISQRSAFTFSGCEICHKIALDSFKQNQVTLHVFIIAAILEMRSAACCRTLAALLFSLKRIVPQIWGR